MVQAARHRLGYDLAPFRRFYRAWLGSVVAQPHVRPRPVVTFQISG